MAETLPSERRGDPSVAVLLTWFLPGAGHLYLGRVGMGVAALVLIQGCYALGWFLADGRTFEYLDPELRGPLATLLAPEAGNLGAMLYHLRLSGFGALEPRPFPEGMVVGSFLTALSGMLNLFVAAHAHLAARSQAPPVPLRSHPILQLAAAWFVPGAGHWLQGRRRRGLIVFVLLAGLFAAGTWLAAGTNLSRERHFYYWSGQFLLGGPAIVLEAVFGRARVTRELAWVDVGLLYACMAGLLNVLAMLDVSRFGERRWFGASEEAPLAPAESGELTA
jgi:TM2 domain-containing membrane protein YozV